MGNRITITTKILVVLLGSVSVALLQMFWPSELFSPSDSAGFMTREEIVTEMRRYFFTLPARGSLKMRSLRRTGNPRNKQHRSIDIVLHHQVNPVMAARGGIVTHVKKQDSGKSAVYIKHDLGLESRYKNLSSVFVEPHNWISAGAQIGSIRNEPGKIKSTLRFEILLDGKYENPLNYIEGRAFLTQEED